MNDKFVVTSIKKLRFNLYKVIFNYEIENKFNDETMANNRIKEDMEFTEQEYNNLVIEDQIKRAKVRGLDMLTRTSKSKMQIVIALKKEGYVEEAIKNAITLLENYKLIDDKKLATDIAKNKATIKKWSKQQMISKLKEKGISKIDIQSASEIIGDEQELDNAKYHAKKKFKSISENKTLEEKLTKTAQSLGYKGFSYEIIKKVISSLKDENTN